MQFREQIVLTLFRMCLFEAAHGRGPLSTKGPPLPKIRYAYPTMVKLGTVTPNLKKILKIYKYMTHPLSSAGISIFYQKSGTFVVSRNTIIDCIIIHNF